MIQASQTVNKQVLRQQLLQRRQSTPPEVWRQKSLQICTHLQAASIFIQARTILGYFSARQEPDLTPLFKLPGKVWSLPRCQGSDLIWHAWSSEDPLQAGAYGIQEPHPGLPTLAPEQVDLILVPAIACDWQGYRLGYGGGFYDRLLSHPAWQAKPTIGIVFEAARLAALPVDPWDQRLGMVCTEAGLFKVSAAARLN